MSYSGYDIEDAIVVNRASLDRGFQRTFYFRKYEAELQKYKDINDISDICMGKQQQFDFAANSDSKPLSQYFIKKYQCLDEDGVGKVGHSIQSGDIFVNKKVPVVSA